MKFDAQIMGGAELGGRLIGLGRMVAQEGPMYPLERAALAGGAVIADGARSIASMHRLRDTGAGIASIAARIVESKDGRAVAAIGPGRGEYYMMFHEIGTSKMRARPFLVPSMDRNESRAVQAAGQVWRQAVIDYARRGRRDA